MQKRPIKLLLREENCLFCWRERCAQGERLFRSLIKKIFDLTAERQTEAVEPVNYSSARAFDVVPTAWHQRRFLVEIAHTRMRLHSFLCDLPEHPINKDGSEVKSIAAAAVCVIHGKNEFLNWILQQLPRSFLRIQNGVQLTCCQAMISRYETELIFRGMAKYIY